MFAGLFCFGVATVVTYHQYQMAANVSLAEKVGFPSKVMIQDFIPGRDTNVLDEVDVIAEAAFDKVASVNLGSESVPRFVEVVPIFPVSTETYPLAKSLVRANKTDPVRPVARSDAPKVSSRVTMLRQIENQPLGYALLEEATAGQQVANNVIAIGANGPLVSITGARLTGEALFDNISTAMDGKGVTSAPDMLMISLYQDRRAVQSDGSEFSALRQILTWLGFIFIGMSMMSVCSDFPACMIRRVLGRKPEEMQEVQAVGAFPAVGFFQPIKTQDELRREERAREAEAAGPTTRVISRIMGETY